jgi:hypothetical protein
MEKIKEIQQLERIFGRLDNYEHTGRNKASLPETGINTRAKRTRNE